MKHERNECEHYKGKSHKQGPTSDKDEISTAYYSAYSLIVITHDAI